MCSRSNGIPTDHQLCNFFLCTMVAIIFPEGRIEGQNIEGKCSEIALTWVSAVMALPGPKSGADAWRLHLGSARTWFNPLLSLP